MTDDPPRKKHKFGGEVFTIRVGTVYVETFYVHDSLLHNSNSFFSAALKKEWKEGQQRKLVLPEDEPEVFAAYVEWLYTSNIPKHTKTILPDWLENDVYDGHEYFAELLVFGDKYQDKAFCNACVVSILMTLKSCFPVDTQPRAYVPPGIEAIKKIYSRTSHCSPARRVMVDVHRKYSCRVWLEAERNAAGYGSCTEFLVDLARALMRNEPVHFSVGVHLNLSTEYFV